MDIKSIIEPPTSPVEVPTQADWISTEQRLGIKLPTDYKHLLSLYGSGAFWDTLRIWNPISDTKPLNLFYKQKETYGIYQFRQQDSPYEYLYRLHPAKKALLAFGDSTAGDAIFWLTDDEIDEWKIVVLVDFGPHWELYDMTITELLCSAAKGELKNSVLLSFDDKPYFTPLPTDT